MHQDLNFQSGFVCGISKFDNKDRLNEKDKEWETETN